MATQNKTHLIFKKLLPILHGISILILILSIFLLAPKHTSASVDTSPAHRNIIRITSEGTVEGTDKISRSGDIYTLIDDIVKDVAVGNVLIHIDRNGAIFDGAGKTLQGTNMGIAIEIDGNNVTIKNTRIINFGEGIKISYDAPYTNNQIINNYFETQWGSVTLRGTKHVISGNTFIAKNGHAIEVWSNETTFINNKFTSCSLSYPYFIDVSNMMSGNTINDKPLMFLKGQSNQVIDNAGQVILIDCTDMVIQNIDDIGLSQSIQLFGVTNTKITNCKSNIQLTYSSNNTIINNKSTAAYISLTNSNDNTIINNELSAAKYSAVRLYDSSKNMITQNSIEGEYGGSIIINGNSQYNRVERNNIFYSSGGDSGTGIQVSGHNNYVYENNIAAEDNGIAVDDAEYNFIFNNKIYQCKNGITMVRSMYNNVFGNTFSGVSGHAVYLFMSDHNNFFYNSFEGNTKVTEPHTDIFWLMNATYYSEYNKWDNGKEGNYWSDYKGKDSWQGIGETPYAVYDNFIDNYPLTQPYDVSKLQITFETWDETYTGSTWDETYTGPQSPNFDRDTTKNFPWIPIVVIGTVVMISVVLLWQYKKRSKTESD